MKEIQEVPFFSTHHASQTFYMKTLLRETGDKHISKAKVTQIAS
jgi:hypothetical protein